MQRKILFILMTCMTLIMVGCANDEKNDSTTIEIQEEQIEQETIIEDNQEEESQTEIIVMNLLDAEGNVFELNDEDAEKVVEMISESSALEIVEDRVNNIQIIVNDTVYLYHSSYGMLTCPDENKTYTLKDKAAFNDILDNYILMTVVQEEKELDKENAVDSENFDKVLAENEKIVILETKITPANEGDEGAEQIWGEDGLTWGIVETIYQMGDKQLTPYYELEGELYAFSVILQDKDGNIYCSISNDMVSEDGVAQLTVVEKGIYDQLMEYYY